ncbi:hypothetical protein PISMIDRAFT_685427 [Pisolithus microcarpus 441]|uniref:Uncharacterized protein n=1 Tax=Pisolithus microcarpus 441 TaxID=765257 RepID=A0A0C9XXR7_9AGAM|nr:hypothetical protein BKA83DRAFT_685427 [Pisolithus microcarpus]KIK17300.1 hypothetical protein PISMIDRAFT_685427 [Pisolithus microcarpus 441]
MLGGPGTSGQQVHLDGKLVRLLCFSGRTAALILSGLGTPHEHTANHIPPASDQGINLPDLWAVIYALFTKYHEQGTIPIVLSAYITHAADLCSYVLRSGLGPVSPSRDISQECFGFHERGWLPLSDSSRYALSPFPSVQSFTRTPLAIAAHPLRPQSQTKRVNKGWSESGSLQKHLEYVKDNPTILPIMMSWDGDLKDWDRGMHVLVGEEKYRSSNRAQARLRFIFHYCFLADLRTERAIGEPRAENASIIKVSLDAAMHVIFDFPYKRSVTTCVP